MRVSLRVGSTLAAGAGARAEGGSVKDNQGGMGWSDTVSAYTMPALPPTPTPHSPWRTAEGWAWIRSGRSQGDTEQQNVDT